MATQLDDTGVDANTNEGVNLEAVELGPVELLAQDMGWDPNFEPKNGKAKKSAADWIKSGADISSKLKDDVKSLRSQVDRIASAGAKSAERMLKQQAEEIEGRFAAAVEAKDTKAAATAAKDMRELEASATPSADETPDVIFAKDNPWYGKEVEATDYAVVVSNRLVRSGVTGSAMFDQVAEAVKKRFPEVSGDAPSAKRQPSVNEPSNRSAIAPQPKTFAAMPAEAKKAADTYFAKFENFHKQQGTKFDRAAAEKSYASDFYAE